MTAEDLKGLAEDTSVFLSHHLDSCIKNCSLHKGIKV